MFPPSPITISLQIRVAEISFLQRVSLLSLWDMLRRLIVREEPRLKLLILHIEMSRVRGMPDVHFLRWGKVLSGNGLGIDPGHIRARCWVRELINYSSQYTLLLSLHSYKRGRQEVRNNRGGKKKKKAPQKPNPQDKMLWFALHVSPPQQWTTSVLHTESRKDFNSKKQQEEIYCE